MEQGTLQYPLFWVLLVYPCGELHQLCIIYALKSESHINHHPVITHIFLPPVYVVRREVMFSKVSVCQQEGYNLDRTGVTPSPYRTEGTGQDRGNPRPQTRQAYPCCPQPPGQAPMWAVCLLRQAGGLLGFFLGGGVSVCF